MNVLSIIIIIKAKALELFRREELDKYFRNCPT